MEKFKGEDDLIRFENAEEKPSSDSHLQVAKRRLLAFSGVSFLVAGALGAYLLSWRIPKVEGLLVVLGGACLLPAVISWLRGNLDIFEPVYVTILATFVYFVVNPAVRIAQFRDFEEMGVDYSADLPEVLALALLALLSFYVGYYMFTANRSFERRALIAHKSVLRYAHRWATILLVFFALLVGLWIIVAGFPLRTLWVFSEATETWRDWQTLSSGPNIGYLYGARESIPACLLLVIATDTSKRRWGFWRILLWIAVIVFLAGMGSRSRVLLAFVSMLVFFHLERGTKPGLWQVLVVGSLFFYAVVGGLGFYRLGGRTLSEHIISFEEAWEVFLASSSIVIASAVVVRFIPSVVGYAWGREFLNLVIQPIPGFLWPGKYSLGYLGSNLSADLFHTGAAPALWTIFYRNFGSIGVIVGMLALGWVSRYVYDRYRYNQESLIPKVVLALYLPLLFTIYGRGHISLVVYRAVRVLMPVWILSLLLKMRLRHECVDGVGSKVAS